MLCSHDDNNNNNISNTRIIHGPDNNISSVRFLTQREEAESECDTLCVLLLQ